MVARLLQLSIFIVLLLPITTANALSFTAAVDARKLQAGNSFQLTLTADENALNKQPDLSPLKQDFEVLQQQKSSQVKFVNGEISSETQWQLTLLPKSEGYLVIPPLSYGAKKTKAIPIQVTQRSNSTAQHSSKLVYIEAEVEKNDIYVQEQVIFYLRIFKRAQLLDASLSKPESEDLVIERLGEARSYTTKRNGYPYEVTEYRFAAYPQKSGTIVIPASVLTGSLAAGSRRFMFDPFGNAGKPIRRKSEDITLTVKAIPATYPENIPWIPAKKLSLSSKWSPLTPTFTVGEPATRTVTLQAIGVAAASLPPLPQPDSAGIKIYPDQPSYHSVPGPDGVESQRTESYAVIPTKGGTIELPAISVHWWNTSTDSLEIASIPPQSVQVMGSQRNHQTDSPVSLPPPTISNTDIAPPSVAQNPASTNSTWIWIALSIFVAWILTLAALFWAIRRNKPSSITKEEKPDSVFSNHKLKESHQQFIKACKAKEPRRTEKNLSAWAAQQLQDRSIRSSGAILQHIEDEQLEKAINELQAVLYRKKALEEWNNQLLLDASDCIEKSDSSKGPTKSLLDLHPSSG